jgi:hypothetical protein
MPAVRSVLAATAVSLPLALLIGGCGGSSTKSSLASSTAAGSPTVDTTTTSTSATPTPTGPATTAPTTAAVSTTATGGRPACVATGLQLRFLGQQGAAGHGLLGFALRNTGSSSCHTYGYPGVLFLDHQGNPLPTAAVRVTADLAGAAPKVRLNVERGSSVSFRLVVSHGLASSA